VPDFLAQPGLSRRPARRVLRYAGLVASLSAAAAADVMTRLRSSRQEIQFVSALVSRWHAVGPEITGAIAADQAVGEFDVRRWAAAVGRLQIGAFLRLANAVWAARRRANEAAPNAPSVRRLYRRLAASALRDPIDLGSLAVDGDDLRRAGIPPGPRLGSILNALLGAVLEDPARNTPDWLLSEALRMFAASGGDPAPSASG
jgi:hypothetical protein